ncbi:ATP-dependent helicase [Spirulina subsalsa FACHB-351]|uniref:DNA 3'-5' helicase n=1 Tax=Spirulina subsalsa FACHB-351 TaxID=234711 RepID=A0ABT3L499_9CYAN|nr:ATP-dependent helicase [Spirulina subsalsa]MCW6036331.1 ATP-dependent helicase [Spirulina subsalsa FACHB-351]
MDTLVSSLQEETLTQLRQGLRPGQRSLADWQGGRLAVSAVPGAGKSHSMAVGAAIAIARHQLNGRKQLILVTFTRTAAASIKSKVKKNLQALRLPQLGFQVYTLHGLAFSIASRHPEASGIDLETFTLISPNQNHYLVKEAVEQWIRENPALYQTLLEGTEFDGEEAERLRRQSVLRTEVLPKLAMTVIQEAKSSGFMPEELREVSAGVEDPYQTLTIAAGLYTKVQQLMERRNFIDYDDMILAARRVLDSPKPRPIWQDQVFAVFEDEAQDSTPLQTELLEILATPVEGSPDPNIVRVGDPNQAINSTFTPADPIYFNHFCEQCARVASRDGTRLATMNQAGRSCTPILKAANYVLHWVNKTWNPNDAQNRPFRDQDICPVDPHDPQPNPPPTAQGVEIHYPEDIYQTVEQIGQRIQQLLTENPHHSAAILVRENRQGRFIGEQLAEWEKVTKIKVHEVGAGGRQSEIPNEMLKLLQFVDRPHSPDNLKAALEVLDKREIIPTQDLNALATAPEQFLYPTPLDPPQKKPVQIARKACCQMLNARLELPYYQLISFFGMTLGYQSGELATVQKLADRVWRQMEGVGEAFPRNRSLKAIISVLQDMVSSEDFENINEEPEEQPEIKPGQVTIITMHKAKGLDWDYVFLPFLHHDILPGSPWIPRSAQFLGDFTLPEIARAQVRVAVHNRHLDQTTDSHDPTPLPNPQEAWQLANQLKQAEEYRLFYVAMTRAKRLLWMSAAQKCPFRWSVFSRQGGDNLQNKEPATVLKALEAFLRQPKSANN